MLLGFYINLFKVRSEEKDKRQDLYILATSYSGQLKAKSAKMIHEKDFHTVSEKVSNWHENWQFYVFWH